MSGEDSLVLAREWIEDPGSPGSVDVFGGWYCPPGWRWETDAELRTRIKKVMGIE